MATGIDLHNIISSTISQNGQQKEIYTAAEVTELQRELLVKQQQMEDRMWADSTLSKFDDILRTNYDKSILEFSEVVIYQIAKITNAIRGSFYTVVEQQIEATGCYACTLNSLFKTKFEIGEGLIGQSVKSKEILYLENLPQQNLSVSSSSGMLSAKSVIVVPLIFNDKSYGVIELLFLASLEEKYKDLLSRLSRNVATMLQSIQSNAKTKELLTDSIFQTEALRSAEEELRQNMEEINTIRDDIEQKNIDLNIFSSAADQFIYVVEISPETILLRCNDKFLRETGYSTEELLNKNYSILMDKTEFNNYQDTLSELRRDKVVKKIVKRIAKNGKELLLDATYYPIMNEQKQLVKIFKMSYNLSEQAERTQILLIQAQQQGEELRAQEEELRQNMEELATTQDGIAKLNVDLGIFIAAADQFIYVLEISPETILLRCNDKFLRETGYFADELVNNNYSILMDKAEFNNYQDTLNDLKQGEIVKKIVKRIAKDKTEIILDATYYPVMNDRKQLVKIFKLSYNLTEQSNKIKSLEAKLNGNKK